MQRQRIRAAKCGKRLRAAVAHQPRGSSSLLRPWAVTRFIAARA
jgi:hypothetical protein